MNYEDIFVIGEHPTLDIDRPHSFIKYAPYQEKSIIIESGFCVHDWAGKKITPSQALKTKWHSFFRDTDSLWFLELVSQMARGVDLSLEDVKHAHMKAKGKPLIS